jgi:hypothetical protein
MPKDEWKRYKKPWVEYQPRPLPRRKPNKQAMPFGRHKGKLFRQIPEHYLRWVLSLDNIDDLLRQRITSYLSLKASRSRPLA